LKAIVFDMTINQREKCSHRTVDVPSELGENRGWKRREAENDIGVDRGTPE
jgi:hypothetical protein